MFTKGQEMDFTEIRKMTRQKKYTLALVGKGDLGTILEQIFAHTSKEWSSFYFAFSCEY